MLPIKSLAGGIISDIIGVFFPQIILKKRMNTKILCLLHLPPPDYGVTLSNQRIVRSRIGELFELDSQAINTARSLNRIEHVSLRKILLFVRIFFGIFLKLIRRRYRGCYFSLTPVGIGFYKDFLLVLLLKVFRVKTLYHLHGKGIARKRKWLSRFLYRISFKNAYAVVLSPSLRGDVSAYLMPEQLFVLPNGIPREEGFDISGSQPDGRDRVRLLFLSNMVRSKGVFLALETAQKLKEKGYEFIFRFAGDWFDIGQEEFYRCIEQSGLKDCVEYVGFKRGEDKYRLLRESDIFLYPTFHDAFPSVILEAMQCGLPVISTREGAIPDMIEDGRTGFVVNPYDVEELTVKTEQLIRNPQLRESLGEAARQKFLSEYTFEKFEQGLIAIFNKVFYA